MTATELLTAQLPMSVVNVCIIVTRIVNALHKYYVGDHVDLLNEARQRANEPFNSG
jgi:hypothetical protein